MVQVDALQKIVFFLTHISIYLGFLCWKNNYSTRYSPLLLYRELPTALVEADLQPKTRIFSWMCVGVLIYLFIYLWYTIIGIALWPQVQGFVAPVLWETINFSCSFPKFICPHYQTSRLPSNEPWQPLRSEIQEVAPSSQCLPVTYQTSSLHNLHFQMPPEMMLKLPTA